MERTELVAREAIRDLLASYTWAGDRGRSEELAACFTAEGVLDVGDHGGEWTGRDAIRAELDTVAERVASSGEAPTRVAHHVSSVAIELRDPTAARVRSYFCVFTEAGADHWGAYLDDVVLDPADGEWRFARRTVRVTGRAADSRFAPPSGDA